MNDGDRHAFEELAYPLLDSAYRTALRMTGQPAAAAADQYAQSQESFTHWFKDRVQSVTGINPDTTPLGPPTEAVLHLHGNS